MAEMDVMASVSELAAAAADQDTSYKVEPEYRIVLIGRKGSGKSATGNNILGKKAFISQMCGSSVQKRCEVHTSERFGKKLVVVDTPGLFDTTLSNDVIATEILKCIGILFPGPHAFILVVQVGRFTQEEQDTVTHFSSIFGEEFYRYLIVLFTRKDDLENEDMTIHEYVKNVPDKLKDILQKCGHKYVAFDNSPRGLKTDADALELVEMVQAIIVETGKSYYSNEMFEKEENEFQRRAAEFRHEEKEKIDNEKKKIQRDLEAKQKKIEAQRNENEAQKKEIDSKRKEIEAKELELQTKEQEISEKLAEALQKQEVVKKESEAKEREIEAMEIVNAKLGSRMKLELEEREKRYLKQLENMLDDHRKEYENKNENVIAWFINGMRPAVQSVGNAMLGLIFLLLLSLVFEAFKNII